MLFVVTTSHVSMQNTVNLVLLLVSGQAFSMLGQRRSILQGLVPVSSARVWCGPCSMQSGRVSFFSI